MFGATLAQCSCPLSTLHLDWQEGASFVSLFLKPDWQKQSSHSFYSLEDNLRISTYDGYL